MTPIWREPFPSVLSAKSVVKKFASPLCVLCVLSRPRFPALFSGGILRALGGVKLRPALLHWLALALRSAGLGRGSRQKIEPVYHPNAGLPRALFASTMIGS